MCVVSMVGDYYRDRWERERSPWYPYPTPGFPPLTPPPITPVEPLAPMPEYPQWPTFVPDAGPSREEFDTLKKEVAEMLELLRRAKKYDEDNNQPNCEIADKMEFLRKVAKLVGVDLDEELSKK